MVTTAEPASFPAPSPLISVIIPVWNSERRIAMALEAIARQTAPRDLFEVIVVDNGSTDGTADAARRFGFAQVLSEPIPSSYRARNRGLAAARGEYVLFTDGDCVPDPDWIAQALAETREKPDLGVVAGEVTLFRENGAGAIASSYEKTHTFNQKGNVEIGGFCITANWLCRRDDLRAIGGFDADLLSAGDSECSRRMVAAGHRLSYSPRMIVRHPTRASIGELIRKRRRVTGGRWHADGLRQRGVVPTLKLFTREAVNQARATMRSDSGMPTKVAVLGVIGLLLLSTHAEVLRLSAGRPPFRA
ncbi:glycosyltransferase [Paracoccus aeridis]|uniref:glycosyltransferase n=1 Tax=Paracoccus aeridis TaxID=1966466 RepID=UPI0010AAF1D0|nr:glycosyltransferase [Paracoccus aeridis]